MIRFIFLKFKINISLLGRLCFSKISVVLILMCTALITQCSKTCTNHYNQKNYTGHFKIGDPYKIKNQWHYPHENKSYDEIGTASWYGSAFHCNKTANNEYFNKKQLSAAHKTLPLPSIAKVTNLKNGKSIEVVINDRGPFVGNRIIDLSERAAQELGMKHLGIAEVRVQYDHEKTNLLHSKIKIKKPKAKNNLLIAKNTNSPKDKNIHIAVGKFSQKKDAIKSLENLKKYGNANIKEVKHGGKIYYNIMFKAPKKDAIHEKKILKKIIKLGYSKAQIVKPTVDM